MVTVLSHEIVSKVEAFDPSHVDLCNQSLFLTIVGSIISMLHQNVATVISERP